MSKEKQDMEIPDQDKKDQDIIKEEKKINPNDSKKAVKEEMMKIKVAEYEKIVQELSNYKDKYMRLFAEFDNVRKRYEREKLEFVKYANEGLLTEFLGVLDNLERSIDAAKAKHQDYAAFLKGMEMVMKHLQDIFNKSDVEEMKALGKKFDPHCHEVLMQEESQDQEDSTIIEEFQKGYLLGGKVIRTAKVKVAMNQQKSLQSSQEQSEEQKESSKESNSNK